MWCHVAFFRGFRLADSFEGADAALSPSLWEIFDASLHQDRATMSGSFCSRCTGILTANKWVTVCSFVTSSLAITLQPSRAVPLIGFGVNKSENEAVHGCC